MKLLCMRGYYPPEQTAGMHLDMDFNEGLEKSGIEITYITPMPTRDVSPEKKAEYKNRVVEKTNNGYVTVKRFRMIEEKRNPLQRALRYFCCNVVEYFKGIKETDTDVVYSSSTPPTQGLLSSIVAHKLSKKAREKIPFVYNLQDIFPDSMVNANMTRKGSMIWKIGRKMENYIYKNADEIIVISEGFKTNIMAKGVPEEKITVISNWIDLDAVTPIKREDNTLFEEFDIDRDKYIIVYAGNVGAMQGTEVILEAAKILHGEQDIHFVIFGGGSNYEEIKAEGSKLSNVSIFPLQPQERVSEVYSMGDVALITCKPGTGKAGLPSKTWSIMACNTPIIASFDTDSDLAYIINNSNAGRCIEAGNAEKLADAIVEMKNKGNIHVDMRAYALDHASKDSCVKKYVDVIANCGLR